jgi:hypothetical protein
LPPPNVESPLGRPPIKNCYNDDCSIREPNKLPLTSIAPSSPLTKQIVIIAKVICRRYLQPAIPAFDLPACYIQIHRREGNYLYTIEILLRPRGDAEVTALTLTAVT